MTVISSVGSSPLRAVNQIPGVANQTLGRVTAPCRHANRVRAESRHGIVFDPLHGARHARDVGVARRGGAGAQNGGRAGRLGVRRQRSSNHDAFGESTNITYCCTRDGAHKVYATKTTKATSSTHCGCRWAGVLTLKRSPRPQRPQPRALGPGERHPHEPPPASARSSSRTSGPSPPTLAAAPPTSPGSSCRYTPAAS